MLESRMCIGWQWFKYMDNDTTDTSAELSNTDSNKGIVTTTYRPYTAMLDEMQKLNCRVYAVAAYFDAITPVAPALSVLPSQPQSHGWVLRIAPVQRSVPVGAAFLLDGRLPGNVPACGTRIKARAVR